MGAGAASVLGVLAVAVALGLHGAHRIFSTQCFSHQLPSYPNHGLTAVRDASPSGLDAAAALLELHLQRSEPLLLRESTGMHGWDQTACWTPDCLRERFGSQPVDAPGRGARPGRWRQLSDWLDAFFDSGSRTAPGDAAAETEAASGCFGTGAGSSHCSVDEGGAPFCASPCFTNATLNFGLHPHSESFTHWHDALASTGWLYAPCASILEQSSAAMSWVSSDRLLVIPGHCSAGER